MGSQVELVGCTTCALTLKSVVERSGGLGPRGLGRSSNGVALFFILSLTQRLMEAHMNDDYVWVQLLPFAIWLVVVLIPAISICKRVGKTPWWAVLAVIPPFLGLIIFLYIIAYSRWTVRATPSAPLPSTYDQPRLW